MDCSTKMKTNFKKVMEFNRAFDMVQQEPSDYSYFVKESNGNIKYNPFKYIRKDIFKESPETIKLRLALIKEEIEELNDAYIQNDIIEERDACADILYVVYGMADVLGISIDDVFNDNINKNLEYYINTVLTNDFASKTDLTDTVPKLSMSDINNIGNLSNFNKIKLLIKYDILGYEINNKNSLELKDIIISRLNETYKKLENNCFMKDSESNFVYDYNTDSNIFSKFELVSDSLYNLLRLAYLMTYIIGIDADYDFAIVHDSNMSKLCDTKDDAISTVEDYKIKYESGISPYDSPYYYYLPTLDKWIVKNLSTGKALKNIKYKKVCFSNTRFVF
jgi:predicted HAD superfamily Cof-like phosphohydrolase